MAGLNKVMLIGNLGADPEMRYTPNGNPVASFRMAASSTYTSGGERRQETEWFTVVTWNKLAETCNQYLTKGQQVYVEGRLHTRSWEQDGQMRYRVEVVASKVLFLSRPGEREDGGVPTTESAEPVETDELPF